MSGFISCDCCGRLTNRLHHGFTCGTEYAACDECCDYDWDAYGEAPAEYLDPDRAREDRDERLALERMP
jgi:hypothetical protein